MAEALDVRLRQDQDIYDRLLATLKPVTASESDAIALWELWSPEEITEGEREAFLSSLYSADEVGSTKSLLGKRSTTLALVLHHLTRSRATVAVPEIRSGMALSVSQDGEPYDLPDELVAARNNWLTLQMRQLQRLSMECLLSWCERSILKDRINETSAMAEHFSADWGGLEHGFERACTLGAMIAALDEQCSDINGFIGAVIEERLLDPFEMMAEIQRLFKSGDPAYAQYSFAGILLCVTYSGVADEDDRLFRLGGSARLSLANLRRRIIGLGDVSVREAFQFILESMIISQHFSTAVNRFDGQNQRLRLTIEETGLEVLVDKPWQPTVTEDRLATLLSLAAQSGLVGRQEDRYFAIG